MPNVDQAFPSKYLKASDLPEDGSETFTIEDVDYAKVGEDKKLVVSFEGQDKGLVLNKTNANIISKLADSRDTDDWKGNEIALYRTEVEFKGDTVESIRVRTKAPKAAAKAAGKAKAAPAKEAPGGEEEPF